MMDQSPDFTNARPEFEARLLQGDGLALRVDRIGPVGAMPVLFFHGGGQSRRAWYGAARKVAAAGYQAFSVDLRGHGQSDWCLEGRYELNAFARDVEQLIEGFDQPVVLVGASRGGQAALVAASRRQERVRLLLLADVAPVIDDSGVDGIRAFLGASQRGFATLDAAADALAKFLDRPRMADPKRLASHMWQGEGGRLYWLWDPKTAEPKFLYPPSERQLLEVAASAMRRPTMLVRGGESRLVTDDSVRLFRELMPTLEVHTLAGAGHMFTGDQNDAFADTLIERLQCNDHADTQPCKSEPEPEPETVSA